MDTKQRQWAGIGWALVAGCLAFAVCCGLTAALAESRHALPRLVSVPAATKVAEKACLSEFYAYLKVAEVAKDLGSDRDILDFALDDLQANVVDCLKGDDSNSERDAVDETDSSPLSPRQQAELRMRACELLRGLSDINTLTNCARYLSACRV
jgi:hypothetical protein